MKYRAEIDGLRALAVVPVVLFHANFSLFSGGFVGVDVFFVISGYLITTIILTEQEENRFTLATFYERRARRILPALLFITFLSMIAAWYFLLPSELIDFGQSLIAVGVFASNILFAQQSNYFAPSAEFIPLLHTWSLAVEEQFYVIFPLFMIFTVTWLKRSRILVLSLLGVLSFVFAEWAWRNIPESSFFLTFARAWEIIAGIFCAFYLHKAKPTYSSIAQLGSILGMILVCYSIFFYSKDIPFPSVYTIVPVFGAVLLIVFARSDTFVGKLLSIPLLVGIGLISYSAYLWHQPLFVFARINSFEELSAFVLLGLSVVAFVLAYFSWRWIEKPFRNRSYLSQPQVLWLAVSCSLILFISGLSLIFGDGFEQRFASFN